MEVVNLQECQQTIAVLLLQSGAVSQVQAQDTRRMQQTDDAIQKASLDDISLSKYLLV